MVDVTNCIFASQNKSLLECRQLWCYDVRLLIENREAAGRVMLILVSF